jgi:hypothetical protein
MRVARYWIRQAVHEKDSDGAVHRGEAWGWSEHSAEEAVRRARESASRVARWLASFGRDPEPPRSWLYQYQLDRPPREEIVQELKDATGETTAMITRNIYGALVLNTRDLMFVDVDFPRRKSTGAGLLKRLFGKPAPPVSEEDGVVSRVRDWCTTNAGLGLRLYRTAAGLRLVVVGQRLQPGGNETGRILVELDSDPLYRRLCEAQECFRARLTPKPYRMASVKRLSNPPARYPFVDAAAETQYRDWQREYDEAAPHFATCRLMDTYGSREVQPELSALLSLHDSLTGIERPLPLA